MILGYNLNRNIITKLILCIYYKSGEKHCFMKQAWLHSGYNGVSESKGQFPDV